MPNSSPVAKAHEALRRGQHTHAAHHARDALKRTPRDPQARTVLAAASLGLGRFEDALEILEPLARERPNDIAVLFNLATAMRGMRRFDEAVAVLDRALASRAADPQLVALKARLRVGQGRLDEALTLLSKAIERTPGEPSLAIEFARVAPDAGRIDEAIGHLEAAQWNAAGLPAPVRHALDFAHADALEAAGRHDVAFEAYRRANAARNMPWDPDAHTARVDAMIDAWTPGRLDDLPRADPDEAHAPIYIVGMPRSGTTLVDQILSMHPAVHAGGEQMIIPRSVMRLANTPRGVLPMLDDPSNLTRAGVAAAASEIKTHFDALADEPFVTDKFPQNMLHLGAIALLTPGARVVHCLRDPLDTCLSCYFQNFLGTMPYMYDLAHIGRFYADYRRLMDHWREALDLPIHDLSYESLVRDQEAETRRLLDFLGLPWEPACLDFHTSTQGVVTASEAQVAKPIYTTSVARWRRHAPRLQALAEALGDHVTPDQRADIPG